MHEKVTTLSSNSIGKKRLARGAFFSHKSSNDCFDAKKETQNLHD